MGSIRSAASTEKDNTRLIRYSMQLAMLRQLLSEKLITDKEYRDVKAGLMKDYKVYSDLTS